jgi:hypothetical protein
LKKIFISFVLLFLSFSAQADAGYFVGLSFLLDGNLSEKNIGLTGKIMNSDKQDEWKAAIGASIYPWNDNKFGIDLGAGYNDNNTAGFISYDLLQAKPVVSLGWVNN